MGVVGWVTLMRYAAADGYYGVAGAEEQDPEPREIVEKSSPVRQVGVGEELGPRPTIQEVDPRFEVRPLLQARYLERGLFIPIPGEPLLHEKERMSRRVIRYLTDDLVPELLVEGPRLEAVRAQVHAPAAVLSSFLFGGFEELPAVSLTP